MTPKQIGEQIAHVLVWTLVTYFGTAIAGVGLVVLYELTAVRWKIGPVTVGQWPAGETWRIDPGREIDGYHKAWREARQIAREGMVWGEAMRPADRVEDLRWDLVFELAGVALGTALQIATLVWWLG